MIKMGSFVSAANHASTLISHGDFLLDAGRDDPTVLVLFGPSESLSHQTESNRVS